jgi:heme exporter protein B
MRFIRKIWAIVWKDLISEFRTKETILSMSLFSFLVLIIFSFAFGTGTHELRNMMPGIIWVAFIFSGLMGLIAPSVRSGTKGRYRDCFYVP